MRVELLPSNLVALRAWFLSTMYGILQLESGSVTSWVRSAARNVVKGGDPQSLHLCGLALDVVFDSLQDQAAALALAHSAGIHYRVEADHVHFQPLPPKSGVVVPPGGPAIAA